MPRMVYAIRYILNYFRTWWYFHVVYPQVEYRGFVRVCKGTSFASCTKVSLGRNIQLGDYALIGTDLVVGDDVLIGGRVTIIGKEDHGFSVPGKTMWSQVQGMSSGTTVIGSDVWLGNNVTVIGPVTIGSGSIIAAGSVLTKDVPPCEVWGGVPARKLRDRFSTEEDKALHLQSLGLT